ncbi:MAG: SUMF1/EgtB/PvdO family nonheme iron enzyme [Immundisolibacteraceae bacterium]|nr:SUMF1/EgtB/PvdO family nonheme iron enzyme [Immundisolibacteraceae bacterium]
MALPKSPIRQLAWDYYLGRVESHEEYLRRRCLLVEAVVNDSPAPVFDDDTDFATHIDLDDDILGETLVPDTSSPPPQATGPGTTSKPATRTASLVVIVLIVAAVSTAAALFLFSNNSTETEVPGSASTSVNVAPDALKQAIQSLEKNGWSESAALDFLTAWNSTSTDQKKSLRELPILSAVTEMVARRSTELETLASAGVTPSPEEQANIEGLLSTLSLPPPRWPDPPAPNSVVEIPSTPSHSIPERPSQSVALSDADETPIPTTDRQPIDQTQAVIVEAASVDTDVAVDQQSTPVPSPEAVVTPSPEETAQSSPPPKPVPARPASIVLSERSGCTASIVKNRVRTCRDFLSSKIRAPKMAVIPAGTFVIGDADRAEESPSLAVTIPGPIGISTHEISYRDYSLYCKNSAATCPANPHNDPQMPVVGITWQQAADFAAWLSERTGKHYRLPSEAEWEYSARAGTTTAFPFGDNLMVTQARFSTRNRAATTPLANTYQAINPNDFDLYHMVGNVREWVADTWQANYDSTTASGSARTGPGPKVVRGGSYADTIDFLRSSARQPLDGNAADQQTGFRVVLDFSVSNP